jgi:hypothetical protein
VSSVNYNAEIQGHWHSVNPQVSEGTSEEEKKQIKLNYASHANYDAYQLADSEGG